ncbi:ABC transporter substrate-binding protein [Actinomadura rugatobispora]|uniref:ABC transporter substrate-binding protein n=1 Tax=Actinomadura rugatobispora TaxID=1994 RepID=A0ABW1A4Q5_9ACTN
MLGEGGQGSVFLGEESPPPGDDDLPPEDDTPSGGRVAIKLLHARLSGDARARARFAAELRVAQRVAAFCTARILDSDVEGDRPYIVSEYIDGPPLSRVLADEGPRSGADLDRLAIGTMTALAAIHQAGVVHRDFKPHNVLLAPDGPRVIDFGIARALDATGTLSSTAVGTPAYMAPEQITGGPVGPQADIFAWGATMIYAANGRPAFGQDSIPAVMHRILNFPPDLGSLGEPLRGLVQACLNKQAAHRPSSQQVLIHLLNLAGSLPQAGGAGGGTGPRAPETEPAAIINHGAEVVSTDTGIRLASVPGAPPPVPPSPPPPAPAPFPQPQPNAWTPATPGPYQQQWGLPGTWPNETGGRKKRGIGVLAGAGSAALVALIVAGSVIAVQLLGDDDGAPERDTPGGRTGGQLRMSLDSVSSDSTGLSPSNAGYGTERIVAKQLYTGLVETAPDGTVRNRLATSITPDSTCRSWKIEVRTGTKFTDGTPVTPESFVRGWTRAAQAENGLASLLIGGVRGFQDVASRKSSTMSGLRAYGSGFQVDLDGSDCEFGRRLGDPLLFPVPESAGAPDNGAYNDQPVGNGPFRVESYVKDRTVTLVRNDVWAFGKAKLDRVVIDLSSDALIKGRTGFQGQLYQWAPLDSANLGASRGDRSMVSRTTTGLNYLVPLTARGPMASDKARLAVSYALDRAALSSGLYGGAYPAANGIVPPTIAGFGKPGTCASCDRHDPARARALAQEAKLGPGTTVPLYVRNTATHKRWGEMVVAQLNRTLGWSVQLKPAGELDLRGYAREITSKDASGLATFAWRADYPSAHNLMRPLLAGDQAATADNGKTNFSGWRNAEFDRIMNEVLGMPDEAARTSRLREAERIALDQMALIPVVFTGNAALRSDKLVGLGMDYDGDPTLATAAYK